MRFSGIGDNRLLIFETKKKTKKKKKKKKKRKNSGSAYTAQHWIFLSSQKGHKVDSSSQVFSMFIISERIGFKESFPKI